MRPAAGRTNAGVPSSTAEIKFPDLSLILRRLEDVQHFWLP
jgi:hypothetical protein